MTTGNSFHFQRSCNAWSAFSIELSYNHPVNSVQQNTIKPLNTPRQLSFECSQSGMS